METPDLLTGHRIDRSCLPKHVAVIMDGNGRWAKSRGQNRTNGHKEGLNAAKRIVKAAADLGLQNITLYTFSTENWKRTQDEVGFLMNLIKIHLRAELDFYNKHEIRVNHIGDLEGLPKDIADEIRYIKDKTSIFKKTCVTLAINYGGKDEIFRAVKRVNDNNINLENEHEFEQYLDDPSLPVVDLMIRTGGERRISNFLIWQSAYAELYFSDKLWPDWQEQDLLDAISDFQLRERRFGGVR